MNERLSVLAFLSKPAMVWAGSKLEESMNFFMPWAEPQHMTTAVISMVTWHQDVWASTHSAYQSVFATMQAFCLPTMALNTYMTLESANNKLLLTPTVFFFNTTLGVDPKEHD